MNNFKRAGIIPFAKTDQGSIILCFGVDTKSGDFSDWGGKIETGETPHTAACRELHEETYGALSIDPKYVITAPYIKSEADKAISFLVEIPLNLLLDFPSSFKIISRGKYGEMKGIKLLFPSDIVRCIQSGNFYVIIQRSLIESISIFDTLGNIFHANIHSC